MTELVKLQQAERMLAEIRDADDALNIIDLAEAARVFAKKAHLGTTSVNHAQAIKLKAEIRMAEAIRKGQEAGEIATAATGAGRPAKEIGSPGEPISPDLPAPPPRPKPKTLQEIGVTKRQSADAQLLAEVLPDDTAIDQVVEQANEKDTEVSRKELLKQARTKKRRAKSKQRSSEEPAPLPGGSFNLIYADPPWRYVDHGSDETRELDNHYPTMSDEELMAMEVPAANDCLLLMWATSPLLPRQLKVMQAWGFNYRTCAVWVKDRPGMGKYWRQQHELLLLGTKGAPGTPLPEDRLPSVLNAPRAEHSRKPDEAHGMVQRMFPHLTARLELFARRPRDGWTTWGNDQAVQS